LIKEQLKTWVSVELNSFLARWNRMIVRRTQLYERRIDPIWSPSHNVINVPDDARKYLVPDNPRLVDLKRRYAKYDPKVTIPLLWTDAYVRTEDITYFRGDNPYVFQVRSEAHSNWGNFNILGHLLATYYVKSIDRYKLLDQLTEDDASDNFIFIIDGQIISRDLLDSIIEIDFLDRHLDLMSHSGVTILDVAGYGRLA
jgi:hypothetical protein